MALFDKLLKTRRERVLLYTTLGVVVGSILLLNVVLPVLNQWSTLSEKLSSKKSALEKVNNLIKNEASITAEYNSNLKGILRTDPKKPSEDSLLLQADEIQKEVNVHFTRLDPVYIRNIPKMPNYKAYTLQVIFEGDLLTVGKFLQGMQERGLYIDYFQLVPKAKAAHKPILVATIRMGKLVKKEGDQTNTTSN